MCVCVCVLCVCVCVFSFLQLFASGKEAAVVMDGEKSEEEGQVEIGLGGGEGVGGDGGGGDGGGGGGGGGDGGGGGGGDGGGGDGVGGDGGGGDGGGGGGGGGGGDGEEVGLGGRESLGPMSRVLCGLSSAILKVQLLCVLVVFAYVCTYASYYSRKCWRE